jgi:DNA-binding transcriptional regulator LsrR (DeoR family)
MAGVRRARADQYARRVNVAAELLASGLDTAETARQLARRYRLSERQAWRYAEQARDQGSVEVPGPKVVFTVKLPTDLVRRVRRQARQSGETISALVAQALKEFLDRLGARSRDGR